MSAEIKNELNKDYIKYLHFAIVLALMFLFRFIPPFGTITPYGMAIIGIFFGLLYGWTVDAENLIWTSLLGLVALGVTDFGTAGAALAAAFNNESVMLMLFGMFFVGMLQDSHLTEWLANKILGVKFAQGHPWFLTAFIIIVPGFLTILVNATLVALIMFSIYKSIFEQAGYKKGDLYPAMVLMGFMIVSSVAFSLFPFRGWCLMSVGIALKAGITINMGGWIIAVAASLLVASFGWILVMFLVPWCKVDKLKNYDISVLQKESAALTKRQKAVLFVLLINIIGCIFISFVGSSSATGFRLILSKIGVYGWVTFLIALTMVWKVEGQYVLNKKTAPSYFYWDLILVVASAMVVVSQITADASGITPLIGQLMQPLFGLSSYTLLFALGLITFVITNFANNVAVTVTMITISMTMATQIPFNLQVALMVITTYGVIGLLTPAGSVNGAMIHAHEFTTGKSAYIAGLFMLVFLTLVLAIVTIPLGLKFMI